MTNWLATCIILVIDGLGQFQEVNMTNLIQLQEAVERIAKMDFAGVPDRQIAAACNISVAKLMELQETEKYKTALADIASESFEKLDVLNGGWDMVENLAMNKVVEHLGKVPDADYALKAAAYANKAIRRGRNSNEPINIQPGQQAVINVSLSFADKLQQAFTINPQVPKQLKKKDNNFLAPKAVNDLLTTKAGQVQNEIADDLGHLNLFVPA